MGAGDDLFSAVDTGVDAGVKVATDAVKRAGPAGQVAAGAVEGAVAGAAVGGTVATVAPVVGFGAAAVAGAAGADAAAVTSIMSASLAVGSAIPIPLIGTLAGLIAGAAAALAQHFSSKPTPEFARELLLVFRTYPNVLREWVDERNTFGIPTEHSSLRSRWGYVGILCEQAAQAPVGDGPNAKSYAEERAYAQTCELRDEGWQKKFERGHVRPRPNRTGRAPDMRVLGLDPSADDVQRAVAGLRVAVAGVPADFHVAALQRGVSMSGQASVPPAQLDAAAAAWRPTGMMLFVYGGRVPVYFSAGCPVASAPDAPARLAARGVAGAFGDRPWFEGVAVTPAPDGGYALRVDVSEAPTPQTVAAVTQYAGLPVTFRVSESWFWWVGAAGALAAAGVAAAAYASRKE
jgi:hypothetical protein